MSVRLVSLLGLGLGEEKPHSNPSPICRLQQFYQAEERTGYPERQINPRRAQGYNGAWGPYRVLRGGNYQRNIGAPRADN